MTTMDFKVGDRVQSAPTSSDVTVMEMMWVATVTKVLAANEHGGCDETVGRWADQAYATSPTPRQLWGRDLVEVAG